MTGNHELINFCKGSKLIQSAEMGFKKLKVLCTPKTPFMANFGEISLVNVDLLYK